MKMYIYSSFGVLECKEMGLQAIEESIPTQTLCESDSTENSLEDTSKTEN